MPKSHLPHEMTILLPNEPSQPPRPLAEELVAVLPAGRSEVGIDILTGAVQIRLYYDPVVFIQARTWLDERKLLYDISFL